MDHKKLFEAACSGNIELVNKSLEENPLILKDVALTSPTESLMHVATKAGQLNFVRELLKLNSELPAELSKDGLRPMDIASILGNVEIVREFLKIDCKICRLEGKDQRRALHYAAINGRIQVINELLSACPNSIKDITVSAETALHLAVKNNQTHAFSVLLNWLERLKMQQIINWRDCDGNTVLHLAASRKQFQTIRLLLSKNDCSGEILEVNATNFKGLTATDVLDIVIENPNDVQLREILRRAGALGAQDVTVISSPNALQKFSKTKESKHELQSEPNNWFDYFKFQVDRDSPSDSRNVLLVVAALIAAVTFQAGVTPPAGILKLIEITNSNNTTASPGLSPTASPGLNPTATPGLNPLDSAVLASQATTFLFLFTNSMGLTASLSIIMYLTAGFPFQRELVIAMFCMIFSYGFSISSITENEVLTYVLLGTALVLPMSLRWLPRWGKKAWKEWRQNHNNKNVLAI